MRGLKRNRHVPSGYPSAVCTLLILIAVEALTACGSIRSPESKSETELNDVTRVSVILPHQDDRYWSVIAKGIEEELSDAKAAGIDIREYVPQINYSIPQMTDILNQQIAAQADVLVVQGNENQEFTDRLKVAEEKGIHVVCMDTDLEELPDHLYVGTNNYEAGKTLGEKLLTLTKGERLTATVISGQSGYPNMDSRLKGLQDVLEQDGSIQIEHVVYDDYDALTFMSQYNACQSDVVICIEGTGAQTLSRMKQKRDDRFRYIVGFDMIEALKNQVMDGILSQDTEAIGQTVVKELIRYKEKGSYSGEKIYTPVQWHTSCDEKGSLS